MTVMEFLYYASAPCIGGVIGAYLGSKLVASRDRILDSFEARAAALTPPTEEEHRHHQENS